MRYKLCSLKSYQIRELAKKFGCSKVSGATLYNCRLAIAREAVMGTLYANNDIINPHTSTDKRFQNSLSRLINVTFATSFLPRYILSSDAKKRKDFEEANGGNPVKAFWRDVSEHYNDSDNNEELAELMESGEDDDQHLFNLKQDRYVNLKDFDQMTHQAAQKHHRDIRKVRHSIQEKMKVSGKHSNDMWNFCNSTNLKTGQTELPAGPVYHFDVLCGLHQAADIAHTHDLADEGKSDSFLAVEEDDKAGSGSSNKPASGQKAFASELTQTRTEMNNFNKEASTQRQTLWSQWSASKTPQ